MKIERSTITLRNMRFHAYHGVLPQERIVGNDYVVTIVMDVDFTEATLSDDVADTLNYAEVYEVVKQTMEKPCNLIERVAWLVGKSLLEHFERLCSVEVSITKVNPPMGADCDGAEAVIKVTKDHQLRSLS